MMCGLLSTHGCPVPYQTMLTAVILWTIVCVFSDHEQQCNNNNMNDSNMVCPNHRFPKYATENTILLLLTNSSNFSQPKNSLVSNLISCFEIECIERKNDYERFHIRHHGNFLPMPVDVIFVIEQSRNIKERKWTYFFESLKMLINVSQMNKHVNVTFNVIFHSAVEKNKYGMITFNQTIIQLDKLENLFSNFIEESSLESVNKVSNYVSLKKNLAFITEMLKNGSLIKQESEVHIVSILDLYELNEGSKLINKNKLELLELVSSLVKQIASIESSPPFLQFVFDASNQVASGVLGNPSFNKLYGDCSHFNKASTLNALLESSLGNTLQAHLLSNGILSRTLTWTDLQQPECAKGLVPAISGHFPMYPTFKNNCHSSLKCPDCFCSPIHGWVNKDLISQGDTSVEDRFPMSSTFLASHEDLARATHDNRTTSTKVQEEKLTIYSEAFYYSDAAPTIIGSPKILQWNPNHEITHEIIGRKEPIVLKNTVVHSWPAMKKWNWSYISNNFGMNTLESVKCTNTYLTFDPDRRVPLKLNVSIPFFTRNMNRNDFFDCIVNSENVQLPNCPDQFLGHYYFGSVPVKLKNDLLPNRFLYNTKKDFEANRQFIWISSSGMITHTHFDQDYNLFVQLMGRKRFTLWSTFQHEFMYTYPRIHPLWHKSQVNYKNVDTYKFPAFTNARAVQIELGPGDMLYVPPYTWHYVETLSPSVSLSTWSHDYSVYDHMNAIYRHDHKFDLIEDPRGELELLYIGNP